MANKRIMTPEEKVLLQAKHRLEEIEARNRKKERNARTRRLIQEGAILESIAPHIRGFSPRQRAEISPTAFLFAKLLSAR